MIKKIVIYVTISFITMSLLLPPIRAQSDSQTELISLDLKGMDIRDVLKILSQKSGLNIVLDSDVKGTVVLYVRDVDVMDALDIIVSTNGLAYEQEGSLIRVMNSRKYEQLYGKKFIDKTKTEVIKLNYTTPAEVIDTINSMKTTLGKVITDERSNTIVLIDNPDNIKKIKDTIAEIDVPLVTEVFNLDYADADIIKDKLNEIVSPHAGSIRFDERTNKIVVKDTKEKMKDIRKVIEAFDEKTKQVLIDAYIIQVTLADKYSYGINWAEVAKLGDLTLTGNTNLSTGLTSVTPSTLTIATTKGNYSTIFNLLSTFGETNVLSRPMITVADKEEAKILVGAKEVYVTSEVTTTNDTYHTADQVQFVDVGVRLAVTPEINNAGYISLKIKPEVSSTDSTKTVELKNPDGSTRTIVPFVTTSEAETTVVVKDSTTLIIGGLMKDTIVEHKEKVPFFADIPIIGRLFSTTGKSKEKTELVIFFTPHIIEGGETSKEAKKYIKDWNKKKKKTLIERPEDISSDISSHPEIKPQDFSYLSNIKKTTYEEYYLTLVDEIDAMARLQDRGGIKGEVELQFRLDRDGFIVNGPVALSKTDPRLVRYAVNCVKQASPFPPFPKAIGKKEAEFYVVVRYE